MAATAVALPPHLADRTVRVHARFPGEVIEIGKLEAGENNATAGRKSPKSLVGDRVRQGQLLAVISVDVGNQRTGAWIDPDWELRRHEQDLAAIRELPGISEISLGELKRQVDADRIAIERTERTLRSWRLEGSADDGARNVHEKVRNCGRHIEVRAPINGMIVEQRAAIGDTIDTNHQLFTIVGKPAPQAESKP